MLHTNPFSGTGYDLRSLESQIERKADKHEVSSLAGAVDRLEHSLREARAEIDGLRSQLQAAQNQIERLENLPDANLLEGKK